MDGVRTSTAKVAALKARCKELRDSGLSYKKIGLKLDLDHTTVMWHLGVLKSKDKKYKEYGRVYMQKRRKAIKNGTLKPVSRGKFVIGEDGTKTFVKGVRDRVKGLDGKYYFWCSECLYKTPWDVFKKTGKCEYCENTMQKKDK